jgi:chromosomal replication initiator protein
MNLWNSVLLKLEKELPQEEFSTWLEPASFVKHTGDELTVVVPNSLFSKMIKKRFADNIASALETIGARHTVLNFIEANAPSAVAGKSAETPRQTTLQTPLNSKYVFDSFVIGKSNELAHAAAAAVADEPGKNYNPLFLYGGVGLGKTHLMHAVGNHIMIRHPHLRVSYVTSELFTNELISAIRFDRIHQFRERFRTIDVLLIDDIQFIAGKERTQEEFFHTFNTLYNSGKQLILSADCPPRNITTLEERLRSRFEWGLIADIQPPDLETKIAILQKKAESESIHIPEDVLLLIATRVRSSIRELEGALIRLVFFSTLSKRPITLEMAQSTLGELLQPHDRVVSINDIQEKVAAYFNISRKELISKDNSKRIAYPRQIAMFLCKKLTSASLPEIGKQFGNKNHSTVLYSIRKVEELIKTDDSANAAVNSLKKQLSL